MAAYSDFMHVKLTACSGKISKRRGEKRVKQSFTKWDLTDILIHIFRIPANLKWLTTSTRDRHYLAYVIWRKHCGCPKRRNLSKISPLSAYVNPCFQIHFNPMIQVWTEGKQHPCTLTYRKLQRLPAYTVQARLKGSPCYAIIAFPNSLWSASLCLGDDTKINLSYLIIQNQWLWSDEREARMKRWVKETVTCIRCSHSVMSPFQRYGVIGARILVPWYREGVLGYR